jgi:uncharacterized protein YciI
MAKKVVRVKRVLLDRSLIEYLYKHRKEHPEWIVKKDSPKSVLKIEGSNTPYSLVISSAEDKKVIAAIAESDPLRVDVFDTEAYKAVCDTVDASVLSSPSLVAIK